ncbi:MAG: hypothetical protein JXR69_09660 [Candidatus Delongbacteria bacterium]|nr:hypothetical protein [Candidatus Delongbacteria bacterium]
MNKILSVILLLTMFLSLNSKILTNIEGVGIADNKLEALFQAKRDVLEKSFGLILSSKSIAKNNMIINDRLLIKSEGYIKKYDIVKESFDEGIYHTTIKAEVTDLLDDILKDEFAKKFLILEMGFPKFGVIITTKDSLRENFAENIIIDNFMRSYFDVHKINDENSDEPDKVDFIIEGSVDYSTSKISSYNIENMYSVHTQIECQIRAAGNDKIISSEIFKTKKAHFDSVEAKRQSIALCSDMISKYLIEDSIEKWSKYFNEETRKLDIVIKNISYETSERLLAELNYLFSGTESVCANDYHERHRTIIINSFMNGNDILETIKKFLLKHDHKVRVESVNESCINLELI